MTLSDGVPPDHLAATTLLGDGTYQHDDHHRDLAAVADAYLEFLADAQTPYYLNSDNTFADHPFGSATRETWIGEASRFQPAYPVPSLPLGVLTDPYVGPGVLTDPIGAYPPNPYYTGPGVMRFLKTGVYSLSMFFQAELAVPPTVMPTCSFRFHAEDGVNQSGRANFFGHGNKTLPHGPMAVNELFTNRPQWSGTAMITVVEDDRVTGSPNTTVTSYPGVLMMEEGVIPLGWDCYPTWMLTCPTSSVENFQMDHLGVEIRKLA